MIGHVDSPLKVDKPEAVTGATIATKVSKRNINNKFSLKPSLNKSDVALTTKVQRKQDQDDLGRQTEASRKANFRKPKPAKLSEEQVLEQRKFEERMRTDPTLAYEKSTEPELKPEARETRDQHRHNRVGFRLRMNDLLPPGYTHISQISPILNTRIDNGFTVQDRLSVYSRKHKCPHGRTFNRYKLFNGFILPECDHSKETIQPIGDLKAPCRFCGSLTSKVTRKCTHEGFLCGRCLRTVYPHTNNSEISCGCEIPPEKYDAERANINEFFQDSLKYGPNNKTSRREFVTDLKKDAGLTYAKILSPSNNETKSHNLDDIINNLSNCEIAHPEGGVTSILGNTASFGASLLSSGIDKATELINVMKNWFTEHVTDAFAARYPTFGRFWLLIIEFFESLIAVVKSKSMMDMATLYYCLQGSTTAKCVAMASLLTSAVHHFCQKFENAVPEKWLTWFKTSQSVLSSIVLPIQRVARNWKKSIEDFKTKSHPEGVMDVLMAFVYSLPTYFHRGMAKTVLTFVKDVLPLLSATKLISDLVPKISMWFSKLFGFWVDDDRDWLAHEMKDEKSPINHAIAASMSYRMAALADDEDARTLFGVASVKINEASEYIKKEERYSTVTMRFLADCDKMMAVQLPPSSRAHEPFCVRIFGPPGVGKSRNIPVLFGPLIGARTKQEFDQASYARGASEYWDGVGKRTIVVYDDFGSNIDTETDLKELLLLVSASPFMANFANIVGPNPKGQSIEPKVVVCCSNIDLDNPKQLLCKKAVQRRFHLGFEARLEGGKSEYRLVWGSLLSEDRGLKTSNWLSLHDARKLIYDSYKIFLSTRQEGVIENDVTMDSWSEPPLIVKGGDGTWENLRVIQERRPATLPYTQGAYGDGIHVIKKDAPKVDTQRLKNMLAQFERIDEDDFHDSEDRIEAANAEGGWDLSNMCRNIAVAELNTFSGFILFANLYSSFLFLADCRDSIIPWWKKMRCLIVPAITGLIFYAAQQFMKPAVPESSSGRGKLPVVKAQSGGEVPPVQKQLQKAFVKICRSNGTNAVNAILVGGHYMLTVEHAFLDQSKNAGYVDEGALYKVTRDGVAQPTTFNFDPKAIRKIYREQNGIMLEVDLVLYELPRSKFNQSRNLLHRFWTGDHHVSNEECLLLDFTPENTQVWRESKLTAMKQVAYDIGGKSYRQTVAQGTHASQPGTCGSPLVLASWENSPILGIHVARNHDFSAPLVMLVTQSMISRAAPDLAGIVDVPPFDNKCLIEKANAESMVVGEYLQSVGTIKPSVFQSTKTEIRHSTLYDDIFPHTTEPSILSPSDPRLPADKRDIDLLEAGIKKISNPATIPLNLILDVSKDMKEFYGRLKTTAPSEPLPFAMALSGSFPTRDVSYIKSIDMSTSPGFPFVQENMKKSDLFERVSDSEILPKPAFYRVLYYDLLNISEGRQPDWVFLGALKDERRPIRKVRIEPKTRMFTVCPVVMNILAKQLYGPFMWRLLENGNKVYYAGGIDRLGVSWHSMISRLGEKSSLGFGTDVSCHDGKLQQEVLEEGHNIMIDTLDLSKPFELIDDPDQPWVIDINKLEVPWKKIADAICRAITYPLYAVKSELIQAVGTLASGLWPTQLLGSLGTEMYLRIAWNEKVPKHLWGGFHFEKFTGHAIMGDDNINVVVKGASKWYNGKTFTEWARQYGIECTSASKQGDAVEIENLLDLCFLKNTTGYLAGFYCPLMDFEAAVEQINWIRKCKYKTPDEMTEVNANNALRAVFFYGESLFTSIRDKILSLKPEFSLLTYNVLYTQYAAYGHFPGYQGEEPTFGDYINEPDREPNGIEVGKLYNEALLGDHAAQEKLLSNTINHNSDIEDAAFERELFDLSALAGIPYELPAEDENANPEMNTTIKCQFCGEDFGTRNRYLDHSYRQHQDNESWKQQTNIHDMLRYAPLSQLKMWYSEIQMDLTNDCSATKTDFVKKIIASRIELKAVYAAINALLNNASREHKTKATTGSRPSVPCATAMDLQRIQQGMPMLVPNLNLDAKTQAKDVYALLANALDDDPYEKAFPESGTVDADAGVAAANPAAPTVAPIETTLSTSAQLGDPTSEKQQASNQEGFTLADKGSSEFVSVKSGLTSKSLAMRAELSLNDQAWNLEQMLQKWQQVAVLTWSITDAIDAELYAADVVKDLITSNFTGAPFQAFDNFRCAGVRIRIVVVGSKFHQGRAVVGFYPTMIPSTVTNPFEITTKKLIEIGAVQLDPSQGGEQEYYIPFRHVKGFLNLLQNDSLGSLHVRVHSQLQAAAGASTDVGIRLFFCLDKPEFKIPRANVATFKQMIQAQDILGKSHGALKQKRFFVGHPESGQKIPQCKLNAMPREGAYIAPVRAKTGDPAVPHFGEQDTNLLNWGKRYRLCYKDTGTLIAPATTEKWWHIFVGNLLDAFWQLKLFALYRGALNFKVVLNVVRDATSEKPIGRLRAYVDADRLQNNKAENAYDRVNIDQPYIDTTNEEVLEFQIPQLSINGALLNGFNYIQTTSQAIGDFIDQRVLSLCFDNFAQGTTLRYYLSVHVALSDEFGAGVFLGIPKITVDQNLPGFWGPNDLEMAHPEMMSSLVSKGLDIVKEKIVPEEVIGSILGSLLDKPAISEQPIWTVNKKHGFMNFATGPEEIDKLVLHPAHQQLCDSEHFGTDNNELELNNLFNRPSFVGRFTWKATDVVGSLLGSNFVGPMFDTPTGDAEFEMSILSYISSKFAYWRGGITLIFDVATSAYHEGRLDITYHPNVDFVPTTYDARVSQYATSITVRNTENCFAITFPYLGETPWKQVTDGRTLQPPSASLLTPNFATCYAGTFAVSVGAPLRVPNNIAQEVEILVYVLPANDYQLSHRTTRNLALTEKYLG